MLNRIQEKLEGVAKNKEKNKLISQLSVSEASNITPLVCDEIHTESGNIISSFSDFHKRVSVFQSSI